MAGYNDLLKDLEDLRKDVAIFRKVVLHAHSPASYDWAGGELRTKKPSEGESVEESTFNERLKSSGLDIVAVTDHMKCGFACRLSKLSSDARPLVLPGMEINLRPHPPWETFRLHVLAIFPEGYSLEQVSKILPPGFDPEERRNGKEEIKDIAIADFVKKAHECGGLCIAAHIDTDRGVRRSFRQLGRDGIVPYGSDVKLSEEEEKAISDKFKTWLLSAEFDGIEVGRSSDRKHYRWISTIGGKRISIPVLLTNDAHTIENLAREQRTTYIKMPSICFEDLKQALQFPDTRVRFPNDVPKAPSPRILGMEITAGDEKGFFKKLQIAFSDNLTCLIGPRGSGKSAIIEAMRYVFGYNRTLDQIEDGRGLAKKVRELQEATLTNCVIRLVYVGVRGEPDILEATYDPKQDYLTRVYTADGEDRKVQDIETSGQYPLRLFGWSEIETLGREANKQRELLDRLVPGLSEKLEQRRKTRSLLKKKRGEIEFSLSGLCELVERDNRQISRYRAYKAEFDRLNTEEVKRLFNDLDFAKIKEAVLQQVRQNAFQWSAELEQLSESDLLEGMEELIPTTDDRVGSWWAKKKSTLRISNRQTEVCSEVDKGRKILQELLDGLDEDISAAQQEAMARDRAIREQVSEEAAKQVIADLRRTASERLQRVEELKREYNREWGQLKGLLGQWDQLCRSLVDLHDEIMGKRAKQKSQIEDRLNKFETPEMKISLRFKKAGDRSVFREFLDRDFFSGDLHGKYRLKQWPEKLSTACTPVELAQALLANHPAELVKTLIINGEEYTPVDQDMAKKIVGSMYPFGVDEAAEIDTVDEKKLIKVLSTAEVEWDDLEGILLNDRPVEHLSPGQRSSAMLPLIALAETAPLVIDQPEDNLDNRLVGEVLVNILANLKEKRQIIVATHNPNIVVSGDAEQVIVLEALSDSEGTCKAHGSIDKKEITKEVIEILEGGRQAFLNRQRKYGLS